MIINLKPIKKYIVYHKLKMDTVLTHMQLVTQNASFCSNLDLLLTESKTRVSEISQAHQVAQTLQIRDIPYGSQILTPGPRQFTEITKPIIAEQQQSTMNLPYLADMFMASDSFSRCQ